MMERPRILLADDHPVFVQGLKGLLEREGFEVVALAADGRQAVSLAVQHRPDVVVFDLAMPMLNGLDAARQLSKALPQTRKILLTNYSDDRYLHEARRAGVDGYLLKTRTGQDLVRLIRQALHGESVLHLPAGDPAARDPLTGREREVLQLIAEAKTTKQIADLLGVGVKTVETYRMRLMVKLDIHEKAGLVRYAVRRGLIQA